MKSLAPVSDERTKIAQSIRANMQAGLRPHTLLPDYVFNGLWNTFLFFQSDWVMDGGFVSTVQHLLDAEAAAGAILANLSRASSPNVGDIASIYLDAQSEAAEYELLLRGNGPSSGWIYSMDRYACTSDVGGWFVYCECGEDIALIGLRGTDSLNRYRKPLGSLHVASFDVATSDTGGMFPFNRLRAEYYAALRANYGPTLPGR